MARHIHDPDPSPVGEGQEGEPQLDGDAPLLLLLEAVRVRPGEGLDERGLAVIDMPRSADDQMPHTHSRGSDYNALPGNVK